jgi:DnaK suppressor protein
MQAFADDLKPGYEREALAQLAQRRADLVLRLGRLEHDGASDGLRWSNHLAEDAQAQQDRHNVAAVRAILRGELLQVEYALEHAAQGKYGVCEDCEREIPPRRLQIVPAATLCVACQARREARARRH